ncbi:MAG: hypothetical protein NTV30_08035 [Chloroflexi bacterium]|nr:hypothetical protein [Chloroflexota bacterium]
MKAQRGQWVPESMPYDVESRKKFKPTIKPEDVSALLDRVPSYKKGPKAKELPDVTPEKDVYDVICDRLVGILSTGDGSLSFVERYSFRGSGRSSF